jgi:hypothetical protein
MPINNYTNGTRSYFQFGKLGTKYFYDNTNKRSQDKAYHEVLQQSRAIEASKHRRGGKLQQVAVSNIHLHKHTQAILFDKDMSEDEVKSFLLKHGYKVLSSRRTKKYIRVKIHLPNYKKYDYRIFHFPDKKISLILQYPKNSKSTTGYAYNGSGVGSSKPKTMVTDDTIDELKEVNELRQMKNPPKKLLKQIKAPKPKKYIPTKPNKEHTEPINTYRRKITHPKHEYQL